MPATFPVQACISISSNLSPASAKTSAVLRPIPCAALVTIAIFMPLRLLHRPSITALAFCQRYAAAVASFFVVMRFLFGFVCHSERSEEPPHFSFAVAVAFAGVLALLLWAL